MVNDDSIPDDKVEVFVLDVMRYLDGLSSPEEFECLRRQLNESIDRRREFVRLCLQSQAMAEGLGTRELVGSELTDETLDDEEHEVYLEMIDEALRSRAIHEIEDTANKLLAEDRRLLRAEAQRRPTRMEAVDHGPRVIVIPKSLAYLGAGMIAALIALVVYLVVDPNGSASIPNMTANGAGQGRSGTASDVPQYVAVLTNLSDDAAWADPHAGWAAGVELEPGELNLTHGSITVRLFDGAEVTLSAPVRFSITDTNHSELHYGQLTAAVPESAHGFEVLIPGGVVTDLGTAFSLVVAESDELLPSQVEVTQGLVTIAPLRSGQRGEAIPLERDQFANVSQDGEEVRAFQYTNVPLAIDVPHTGHHLRHTEADPDWRIRIGNDPRVHSAFVIAPDDWTTPEFLTLDWAHGDPESSQWISPYQDGYQEDASPGTYFYATSVYVPENFDAQTVELALKIMVDNQVMAIRVNGAVVVGQLELPYPNVDRSAGIQYHAWIEQTLSDCFVPGENTVEIEVLNDSAGTGLRVEMDCIGTQLYAELE